MNKVEQHPRKLNRNKSTRSERYGINYCSVQNSSSLAKYLFGSLNSWFPKRWKLAYILSHSHLKDEASYHRQFATNRSLIPLTLNIFERFTSILKSLHFHFIVNFGSQQYDPCLQSYTPCCLIHFSLSILKQSNVSVIQLHSD